MHPRTAHSYVRAGVQDVVFCYLRFPSGVVAHLHLSWLDPHKERRMTVVGSRRMATFDDMLIEGKLTVYDKGFDEDTRSLGRVHRPLAARPSRRESPTSSRCALECEHFVRVRPHGRDTALGRAERIARRAGAGGAAAFAERLRAGRQGPSAAAGKYACLQASGSI